MILNVKLSHLRKISNMIKMVNFQKLYQHMMIQLEELVTVQNKQSQCAAVIPDINEMIQMMELSMLDNI